MDTRSERIERQQREAIQHAKDAKKGHGLEIAGVAVLAGLVAIGIMVGLETENSGKRPLIIQETAVPVVQEVTVIPSKTPENTPTPVDPRVIKVKVQCGGSASEWFVGDPEWAKREVSGVCNDVPWEMSGYDPKTQQRLSPEEFCAQASGGSILKSEKYWANNFDGSSPVVWSAEYPCAATAAGQ